MTRNRQSAKKAGATFEKAVADYLAWALDDARIERRHLSGTKDRGDITGVMFSQEHVVLECKNVVQPRLNQWLREAEEEAGNDDAPLWAVVYKVRGVGITPDRIGEHHVVMRAYLLEYLSCPTSLATHSALEMHRTLLHPHEDRPCTISLHYFAHLLNHRQPLGPEEKETSN
ncbi:hypothetical protein [Bifidobacterium cuniculi]|uniref:Gp66 n=1 Tax=Bifidobacterium cuniculi TaxID=1688 RepID=A0A087B4Z5_9BIFI|nr:hypothetical protein [Bifidobacterium cuniculi]KFI66095.1 gp66 [Bifidobacterium cuniculi]